MNQSNELSTHGAKGPKYANRVLYGLCALCGVMLAVDAMYHKHGHFEFEQWFGFFPFFGLLASFVLLVAARLFRVLLQRPEDYYDG